MQEICPQGVLSQAETPPALGVYLLQMSPSLPPDEQAGRSEHRLAGARRRRHYLKGTMVPRQLGDVGGA